MSETPVRSLPARRDVPAGDTWDLASLFGSDAEWERALGAWEARIPEFAAFAGTLGRGPERLAECLAFDLGYDREGRHARSPLWVGNPFECCWVVIAPFGFSEPCMGPQDDPIRDGVDERVLRCVPS